MQNQQLSLFVSILFIVLTTLSSLNGQSKELQKSMRALNDLSDSFESLAEYVGPSTVQIVATGYSRGDGNTATSLFTLQRNIGSGVIVDPNGYIVTNAHVVGGATRIQVQLPYQARQDKVAQSILKPSGRRVAAELVGIDEETDIAVLKVDETRLPALPLGNSDNLRQGQIVLAFGTPLGLNNSVTMGVISSVARQLNPEDPMVYIQTDASINPGNSGGPLLDTNGNVIGINTMILSQSGGSEGIGLAAPSNIVKTVLEQIRQFGRVRRGQIGVHAQTISPTLAASLDLSRDQGVILADVYPGSPADKAGLKAGDMVVSMNDKVMENARQFNVNIYQQSVGEKVRMTVQRGAENLTVIVDVLERADDPARFLDMADPKKNLVPELGILAIDISRRVEELLPRIRKRFGVLVAAVADDTPASEDRFYPGDILYSMNGTDVTGLSGLKSALKSFVSGDAVTLHIERQGRLRYITFILE